MRQAYQVQAALSEKWLELDHAKELETISRLLDDDRQIYELALRDLRPANGADGQESGARGLTAEQVVRALLVKQMNGFSYRELAFHLADSRTYQTFCRLPICGSSPQKSALAANIKALRPETLEAIHHRIVELAFHEGVEQGRKLRVDATVVEANIHHPTDSELLWDCVRVLTRLLGKARDLLGADQVSFSDRTRRAKRRRKEINTAHFMKKRLEPYRDLIRVTEEVRASAQTVRGQVAQAGESEISAAKLVEALDRYLERSARVVEQVRRRVLEQETVPASEKIVSIFEDHTDILRKDARDTYYGHKICLTAGSSSLVLDCVVLDGNPPDSSLATQMVERHVEHLGSAPRQVAFDGGFSSKKNLKVIRELGVGDVVFAKGRGLEISDMARSSWVYKRLRNFRAGIEGIISFLKRAFGLDRCTWRSLPSFKSYVWSSIIASNLLVIARHLLA